VTLTSDRPDVSIVIPTLNRRDLCEGCIGSIRRSLRGLHAEVVLVDNGSRDGTVERFRDEPGVVVLAHDGNEGFGAATNHGIATASGRDVVLLNNDTVVTPGWLEALRDAAYSSPAVGIAGPVTNSVSGTQMLAEVGYDRLDGLDAFAAERARTHAGVYTPFPRLVGYAIYVRREVLDAIGGFDTRFGTGNFEDDDLCLRAQVAGFTLVIAEGVFIHHFGSATFRSENVEYAAKMRENLARFSAKWGLPEPVEGQRSYDLQRALCMPFASAQHREPLGGPAPAPLTLDEQPRARVVTSLVDERSDVDALAAATLSLGAPHETTLVLGLDVPAVALDGLVERLGAVLDDPRLAALDVIALPGPIAEPRRLAALSGTALESGSPRWRAACAAIGQPLAAAA
jgi:GT2 family glycosyltransferase